MSLVERIENDFVTAYKNKAESQVAVLRMLKAAIKNRHVEPRRPLRQDEVLGLVHKQIKQRQESIDMFSKAGRGELAAQGARELDIPRAYQPWPLPGAELAQAVNQAVAALDAAGVKGMGRVIQAVMQSHKGRVDGKAVSELVRTRLTS